MFKNYLKIALRFLKQNKLFAGINMFGLSIALAASFIILLYVINELSYDHCHKNRKRVFRVLNYYPDIKTTASSAPYVLGSTLKEKFPQIEKAIRIMPLPLTFKTDNGSITETAISTDSEVFDIFTLPLVEGSPKSNLLEDKNSIVISHDLAGKLFGSQNAVGKNIVATTFDGDQHFTVKGVFANIPENSTFRAQCILNSRWSVDYINKKFIITNAETSWGQDLWITWVLFSKKCDITSLTKQINTFTTKKISGRPASVYSFQNLSDVYLGSAEIGSSGIQGNISSVRIFSALVFLIIIVAAINYIILSIAISTGRTKEIGIRKAFGASVDKIKNQFLSESLLLVSFGLPVALLLMWLTLPTAGNLLHTQLHIIKSNIIIYIFSYLSLVITIGVTSGFYTSAYLSKLNVLDIMNNVSHSGKRKYFSRSFLIVLQLVIFCSFMSGALIIRSQYKYVINKDIGYYTKGILLVNLGRDFSGYATYLNTIKSNPNVIMAAGTDESIPLEGKYSMAAVQLPNFENKEIQVMVNLMSVDFNFIKTMGMSVVEGRDFSEEYRSDISHSSIMNETAVKQLAITDPIGKMVGGETTIGIVKDFNLFSLYSDISPISILISERPKRQIAVHYKSGTLGSLLPVLETEWKKIDPDRPFHYTTIEAIIENLYSSEKNLNTIVSIFALLTLIIAAFGLFGLTLFLARSRTREIGIKKVFGSSGNSIVFSFLLENFILVSIAAALSVPVTIHFITQWLNRFAFKVSIGWWVFVLAYLSATIVVLLTVLYHSYKMSRINPVNALRYV
jgi:ABC-type transport system, involved in lipoprotein release, permease component